ncbi:PTS sugar transporter subunit IIA [Chitinimonas arctica]|uniref:PTS sugar transporter subunit IIA n=2 Tax=Chitinimonas arctica TaxID=2594795 RepID=A0A516SM35_9NEIS|nr:PTS sugar transporter subunit IIA [Chitinimonas arctica]
MQALNTLAHICPPENILLDPPVRNQRELFEYTARYLQNRFDLPADRIATRLAERERMGTTGLGQGVAIPHARLNGLKTALALFIRTPHPIAFDAPDGKPVGEFLLLLVPEHANKEHLQLLADAAQLLCERSFRHAARLARTPVDIHRLMLEAQ